jgi:hypothetical protein
VVAVPEVHGQLEDGEHAEKHFEGVKIQGEGAAGDEAGAFGVEPLADPV